MNIYPQHTTLVFIKLLKYHRICKLLKYSKIINYWITLRIIITSLYSILELLKYPWSWKLQNIHQSVKLLKCLHWPTMIKSQPIVVEKLGLDTSNCVESNGGGGELWRAATMPDRASRPWEHYQDDEGQISRIGGCGWSEIEEDIWWTKLSQCHGRKLK